MARTSSIHDYFDLYLTPLTSIFNLPQKMFQMALISSRAQTVQNCFEIHALLYKLWSGQIQTDARKHGHTEAWMHAHSPNKNCNNYVSLTRKQTQMYLIFEVLRLISAVFGTAIFVQIIHKSPYMGIFSLLRRNC